MDKMDEKMENFSENWNLLKNQVHSLEVKNIVPEIKHSLDGFSSRLYIQARTEVKDSNKGQQKIAELKHREKRMERIEQSEKVLCGN